MIQESPLIYSISEKTAKENQERNPNLPQIDKLNEVRK